jgi:hypothetical protein
VAANLVRTDLSSRVKALVDPGDLRGMSFGFVAGRGNSKLEQRAGKPHRVISGFKRLLDVTTTWNPAYPQAEAQFRSHGFGVYTLPVVELDPRVRRQLQLDELAARAEAQDRELKRLGML